MMWPIKEYEIPKLYLDQFNIRTPIAEKDQNALIRDMFANEEAFEIARSYSQHGIFPDEFPIGIKENSKIVLIEGNRRLAALKALHEPDIIPTWKRRIESLKNPNITKILVVLAPSRDAAIKHIANKHTVNYRRPWKPLRQAYFYKSQIDNGKSIKELIDEYPDHDIPRSIKMLEMHHMAKSISFSEAEVERKIHDERKFPITNLERFYNDKSICDFLGIDFNEKGQVVGKIAKSEFIKGFKKIVEDVAIGGEEGIDSRKYNTAKERLKYIKNFPKQHKPDISKKGIFGRTDFKEVKVADKAITSPTKRGRPSPKGLFLQSDLPFRISSSPLKQMYIELRDIEVKKFPNSTHDLLRSFLECALVVHLKSTGEINLFKKTEKHNPKLSELLNFVSSDKCHSISDESIKQVASLIKSDWKENYSIERMNMINHNENWVSNESAVRSAWARIESLIRVLLDKKA